jgi:hypothetical protein
MCSGTRRVPLPLFSLVPAQCRHISVFCRIIGELAPGHYPCGDPSAYQKSIAAQSHWVRLATSPVDKLVAILVAGDVWLGIWVLTDSKTEVAWELKLCHFTLTEVA